MQTINAGKGSWLGLRSILLVLALGWVSTSTAQLFPADIPLSDLEQTVVYRQLQTLERMPKSAIHPLDLQTIDAAMVQENVPYRQRFFLLAGWLDRGEALRTVPYEYRRSARSQNAYDLALIRTGDSDRIRRLNQLLQASTVDDNFIFSVASQLIYTRRREVFDFCFDHILSNEQNCSPADAHTGGRINCAYRLLELVAPHIEDFPLEVGTSGDLVVDDYAAALGVARIWINEHRADYRINTASY